MVKVNNIYEVNICIDKDKYYCKIFAVTNTQSTVDVRYSHPLRSIVKGLYTDWSL